MSASTHGNPNGLKSWLLDKLLPVSGDDYQRQRFPTEKVNTILSGVDLDQVGSVLDIGCNEGLITNHFSERGKFAVGIDISPFFARNMLRQLHAAKVPAFGTLKLTPESVRTLPSFDMMLVLSVHHWWVKEYGDAPAREMVRTLIAKTKRYFVIEFSSIKDKYGYRDERFVDNDEQSVTDYARHWLQAIDSGYDIRYLGANRETTGREKFRHIVLVTRPVPA
jgi:SAM-dependent methyltransferase